MQAWKTQNWQFQWVGHGKPASPYEKNVCLQPADAEEYHAEAYPLIHRPEQAVLDSVLHGTEVRPKSAIYTGYKVAINSCNLPDLYSPGFENTHTYTHMHMHAHNLSLIL